MINFKKLKRLLLVSGLFSSQVLAAEAGTQTASAPCTITKSGTTYAATGCTTGQYDLIDNVLVSATGANTAEPADSGNPKPGFYKTVSGDYVQCKSFGACEKVTPASGCANNGGKLAGSGNDVGLCLDDYLFKNGSEYAKLKFSDTEGIHKYLVKHKADDAYVFSFAKSNVNYYVVNHPDANSIVFNPTDTVDDKVALTTDGKLIDRTAELCDIANSSGKYYSSGKDSDGSVINNGIVTSTSKTGDPDPDSEEQVKLKFTVNEKTCSATTASKSEIGITVSERGGYLLIKKSDDSDEDILIKYTTSGCNVVSEVGYYRAANNYNSVIGCDSTACKLVEVIDDGTACGDNNIGKMMGGGYNAAVCIDNGNVQRFAEGTDYALNNNKIVFASDDDVTYYKINVTKDSMVLDKAGVKSYFIKDVSTNADNKKYNIYECFEGKCKKMKDTYHYENDLLYTCNDDGECTSNTMNDVTASAVKTGYYLAELKATENKYNSLIKCTEAVLNEGKTKATTPASCSKVTTPSAGYYLDATQGENAALLQCKKEEEDTAITCTNVDNLSSNEAYLNEDSKEGSTYGNVIVCSDKCIVDENKENVSTYYLNAGTVATDEAKGFGLIRCVTDKTTKKTACNAFNGSDGQVYLDYTGTTIICDSTNGCKVSTPAAAGFYVNSGNLSSSKLTTGLIQCIADTTQTENEQIPSQRKRVSDEGGQNGSGATVTCKEVDGTANQVFINQGPDKDAKQIIKCSSEKCSTYASMATEGNNEYYINADDEEKNLTDDVIQCTYTKENGNESVNCILYTPTLGSSNQGIFINANYAESGDKNQLIQCTNDSGCVGKKCTDTRDTEYYINAEVTNALANAVISCAKNKCEKITPTAPTYYVGTDSDINGLITCEGTACTYKAAFNSEGYYLNAGENRSVNQTITCDANDGCASLKVDLGVYVNASKEDKPLIICEKEGSECTAVESPSCPASTATNVSPGSYCIGGDATKQLLQFYNTSNATAIAASKTDNYYVYATVPSNVFPGMKGREISSLFKVSLYYINRFYQSGIIIIDKNNKIVDNLVSGQSDIVLYDCDDSTKLCTQRPKCTDKTYMYDSENKKAIYCNDGTLENAEFNGYVVDTNRSKGSNRPYLIKCENDGKNCISLKPESTSYFENSGYDAATNSLILCSNGNCATVAADIGYYVGREGTGIIQCTSATSCTFSSIKGRVKYVNAGAEKTSSAIIECSRGKCSAIKAISGYYMTYNSSLLIYCSSSSSCAEFTPTVNHYDNADSTESNSTIINCVQNNQYITCAVEATNDGFYMTGHTNRLIRCKSGMKCREIEVKDGIFSGAIKESSGGTRRSDESEVEDEEGKSVTVPRGGDEVYGIIRCVAGKCQALTPSEIAAIPMCEFNNNKCYITLEYSMTKSSTTSISAGNICTNNDRSVFYFATDTIVVKPNVISGVTATYVYTTTNSNCLEVNDSYSDMYFTVGSNIYLLDQGSVLQFYDSGYYFINTLKNVLVSGNDIEAYNDENVKLYKCNGNTCRIQDKPDSVNYYADVNKRILKYNVNSDSFSFAYKKDITCIFANNKCTPNADLKNQEFCITYKGELVLARTDIKNRETGECYKASSINSNIFGYSQYLYTMNLNAAEMVDETGYYIVSLSTNSTVVSKNYKSKNSGLVLYGCQLSSCKIYEPDESTYYYDAQAKTLLRYRNGVWRTPSASGYAYISLNPADASIYRFTKNLDEYKITSMANTGYYYTVDNEMYHCDGNGECTEIDTTGYYFTNAGEVYYCIHDSENLEPTECTKQTCASGQYYSIDDAYYRCEVSSVLVPVVSRYCSYNDNVIMNFPLALTEELPDKIKKAVEGVEKNNNSTAIIKGRSKNYLESVSAIFTNCTYNVEETKSTFDMVCVNNYVSVNENTDEVNICSVEQLGYVECVEDEENPEKCKVSGALSFLRPSLSTILMIALSLLVYTLL